MTKTLTVKHGLPLPDDERHREPVDRVAARVTSRGEHFSGFPNPTDEVCVPHPLPMRPVPLNPDLKDLTGKRFGRLVVVGLSTIQNNTRYLEIDPLLRKLTTPKRNRSRWLCRCDCGMYTLKTGSNILYFAEWSKCFQCRKLDEMRGSPRMDPRTLRSLRGWRWRG